MSMEVWMQYFTDYGWIAIYVIVLLEYMNLPGFPAGIVMPLAGIWAAKGELSFFTAIGITILAGLTGSILLYALGRLGGKAVLRWYYKKFPKQQALIEGKMTYLKEKGCTAIFVSKLIPMVRTLISIPAGVIRMDFAQYCISSALGIAIWNFIFVGAGYVMGEAVFTILA